MSVIGELLLQLFGSFAGDWLGWSLRSRSSSAAARKLLAKEGHVGSGIRAVDGRVLNIGTEWSWGVGQLSPGHVRFVPRMGIVGNREIDVVNLLPAESAVAVPVTVAPVTLLLMTTTAGGLYWLVPTDLVDEIVERLRPSS